MCSKDVHQTGEAALASALIQQTEFTMAKLTHRRGLGKVDGGRLGGISWRRREGGG